MQELKQSRAHLLNCLLSSDMQKIPALTYQGCGNQIQSPTMGKTTRQCTKRDYLVKKQIVDLMKSGIAFQVITY